MRSLRANMARSYRVWGGPQQAAFVVCGHKGIACHLATLPQYYIF